MPVKPTVKPRRVQPQTKEAELDKIFNQAEFKKGGVVKRKMTWFYKFDIGSDLIQRCKSHDANLELYGHHILIYKPPIRKVSLLDQNQIPKKKIRRILVIN